MPTMCLGADLARVAVGRKNLCQVTLSGSETGLSGMGLRWKERSIFDKPKVTVSRTQKMGRRGRYVGPNQAGLHRGFWPLLLTTMESH